MASHEKPVRNRIRHATCLCRNSGSKKITQTDVTERETCCYLRRSVCVA